MRARAAAAFVAFARNLSDKPLLLTDIIVLIFEGPLLKFDAHALSRSCKNV